MGDLEDLMDDYIKPQVDLFGLSSNNLVALSLRLLCVNSAIAPGRYSQTSAASVSDIVIRDRLLDRWRGSRK